MERLHRLEQELFHRKLAVEHKMEPVQHRNTEQEEYKELERLHKLEQLRMPVAEERKLEQRERHRKIAAEERMKKQQERPHRTAVGKQELERLRKLELLGQRRK
jgi:hypothetical protein